MSLDNHSVEIELCEQAKAIAHQYILGNKSTARAMFNTVPDSRKSFITAMLFVDPAGMEINSVVAFIKSVTK